MKLARLWAVSRKELLHILRDPRSRMVVFVPPILQLLVFAFAATLEVRNVDIAVYNQDAGRWSHELVQRLDSARFITHVRHVDSQRLLHEMIDRGEADDVAVRLRAATGRMFLFNIRGPPGSNRAAR